MPTRAAHFPNDLLDARERRVFQGMKTPALIQRFLDEGIGYNKEPGGDTCYSPRLVLREGVAHCMEGALLAAMALRRLGYPPLIVDLEALRDSDHVLAVYRVENCWGAVAQSDYAGLRFREPIYKSIRELAMSYFEQYYNPAGEKSLRTYSRPVNLARFDRGLKWMTTLEEVWAIPEYLCEISHTRMITKAQERRLLPMDAKLFQAGRVGGVLEPLLDLALLDLKKVPPFGKINRPNARAASTRTSRPRQPRSR